MLQHCPSARAGIACLSSHPFWGWGCRGGPSLWSRHSPGLGIYRITSKENVYYLESPPVWLSLWEHRPIHRRSPF